MITTALEKRKDYKEFLSIYPNKLVRYVKNIAPDLTDYTGSWLAKGATLLPDGTLDKSTVKSTLTEDTRSHGIVSSKANSRINLAIEWIILFAKEKTSLNYQLKSFYKWKLNFVTLTLASPQVHSDSEIKSKLLNTFLTHIKRKYGVQNYLWRAESQKNNNIHFHIITDKFLPWKEIRDYWNSLQAPLGYIDKFEEKYKHRNPNGTDVHSLKNIKNIAAYLSKYCSKNSKGITIMHTKAFTGYKNYPLFISFQWQKLPKKPTFYRMIHGRLWGLSQQLSKLKGAKEYIGPSIYWELKNFEEQHPERIIKRDFVTIFKVKAQCLTASGLHNIRKYLAEHVRKILFPEIQTEINYTHGLNT